MAKVQDIENEHAKAYRLINQKRDTNLEFDEWQAAQEKMSQAVEEFDEFQPDDFRIEPVTETDGGTDTDETTADETVPESVEPEPVEETEFDDKDVPGRPIEESTDDTLSADIDTTEVEPITESERSLTDDPIAWLNRSQSEFVDTINGTDAINKKGFRVLQHFYDIDVSSTVVVSPEETDFDYCRVKATAEMPDGRTAEAHGSAHVDRDDDHFLLLEMADTRAKSRVLSDITGVGAVAVAELKSEPNHA